jgi:hypothetical protein
MEEKAIKVHYASEHRQHDISELCPRLAFIHDLGATQSIETLVTQKVWAMRKAIDATAERVTQIVAVGDGDFECMAAHDLTIQGGNAPAIAKTVKFCCEPTAEMLVYQLGELKASLGGIVAHRGDAHLDLELLAAGYPTLADVLADKDACAPSLVLQAHTLMDFCG